MSTHSWKKKGIGVTIAVLLIAVGASSIPWAQWREQSVYQALRDGTSPPFWWPSGWRQALLTSILLEGEVWLRDADDSALRHSGRQRAASPGRHATGATLEIVSDRLGEVFRTSVSKGRYSFNPRRLPAGDFTIRLIGEDGWTSRPVQTGALDPGLHRINLSFELPPGSVPGTEARNSDAADTR
jgi:hypothetical protein